MDITSAFDASTIWTIAGGSVLAYLAGTIAKDRFGLNAKTVGLIFAMAWAAAWAVAQFVPAAASPITIIVSALITGMIVYALAYMEGDILAKLAELAAKRRQPEPAPSDPGPGPAAVSRETDPELASARSATYTQPPPTTAERLRW